MSEKPFFQKEQKVDAKYFKNVFQVCIFVFFDKKIFNEKISFKINWKKINEPSGRL